MSAPTPAISVLMSVRDGARFLPETCASLSKMVAPEGGVEFVVVDDASKDATPGLLADWAAADHRVRVLTPDRPLGLPAALNLGLAQIRAPLVARADADDLYRPDRLVRQATAFAADPDLGVLGCGYERIDTDGRSLGVVCPPTGPKVLRFRMLFMNPLLHPGTMFRAGAVRAAGGYDDAYWTAQDSDLWARLSQDTRIDNMPDALVRYRVHDRSVMKRRGPAGQALSLTVPERLQTAYLGGLPPGHDVAATVRLFQGFEPMEPAVLRAGLAGLDRLYRAARLREPPEVIVDFTQHAARSMLRHAGWIKGRAPRLALQLGTTALRWRIGSPARHSQGADA